MKKLLLCFLLGAFVLSSCEKQDTDLTVTIKNSGRLKVKLAGDDGKGIADTKLQLFLYYSSGSSSSPFDSKKTNSDGVVDFGELIENIYYVVSKDVKVGNTKYYVNKPLMLTSGLDDQITINPQEFVGKITINVYKQTNSGFSVKGANLNVALIEYSDYNDTLSHAQKIEKAVVTGTTDNQGKVVFEKVASSYNYVAYVYIDAEKNTVSYSNSIYVSMGDEKEVDISILESELENIKVDVTLQLYFYGYKNNNYDYYNVTSANIAVVKYNDYYNNSLQYQSLSSVLSYAVATGQTDSEGKLTLSLKANKEYKILVYYNDLNKDWPYNSIYIGSSSTNYSIEVDENNLGISK